ncbi:P-loop containing nucleoside triphosphate hydrolase protein [Lipomyces arxii]|uniref:P-loop containing nucleoside triphosphate hydrolase protein n=1 Tax=Lipomyces arxii TaxID=56418 RepID=UPI0034CE8D07
MARSKRPADNLNQQSNDESADFEENSSVARKRARATPESDDIVDVANNGIIKSVELVNFMCHKYLKLDFGPKINFVIGHNGSGKSAILTGVTVCLGAKAAATQRASSLRSLIKEGCNSAAVVVVLKNEGEDAYRHDKYGDEIRVERVLQISGTSMYRIKSKTGVLVSKDKEELTSMMDHFGLMVDNPMTILSQDTARSFLSSSTPEEKYTLFMKGIRLDSLKQDYDMVRLCLEKTSFTLKAQSKMIDELQERRDEADKLYQQSQSNRVVKDRLTALQAQYAWSSYADKERELEHAELAVQAKQKEAIMAEDQIRQLIEQYEIAKVDFAEKSDQFNDAERSIEPLSEEANQIRQEMKEVKMKLKDALNEEKETAQTINVLKEKIKHTERNMEVERQRLSELDGGRRAHLETQLNNANDRLQQQRSDLSTARADSVKVREDEKAFEQTLAESRAAARRKHAELQKVSEYVRRAEESQKEYMSVFGKSIEYILRDINAEQNFRSKPIGPLGMYIHVKRPEWVSLLESGLGKNLENFVVSCIEDQRLLNRILKKYSSRAGITVRKNETFDYSSFLPDSQFVTALSVLEFNNEMAKYAMIDISHIERIILIEDRKEADEVMYRNPRNVSVCYAKKAGHRFDGFRIMQKRGASSSQPQAGRRDSPRMRVDNTARMQQLKEDKASVMAEFEQLEQGYHQLELKSNDFRRRKQSLETKIANLQADIQQTETEIDHINEQLVASDDNSRITILESNKNDLLEDLKMHEDIRYSSIIAEKDNCRMELAEVTARLEEKKQQRDNVEKQLEQLKNARNEAAGNCVEQQNQLEYRRTQLAQRKQAIVATENEVKGIQEALADIRGICEDISRTRPNIEAGKTTNMLKNEMDLTMRQYESASRELPYSLEEIIHRYNTACAAVDNALAELNKIKAVNDSLRNTYAERQKRFFQFRNRICATAKHVFRHTLDERGFRGRIYIHHGNRTLHIEVTPADGAEREGGKGRNVTTLSGGEKSYTQICLLMALWDAMNTPVRGLDEFDVFMDAVNRKISLSMMVGQAKQNAATQTIFITPQEMTNQFGDDVKIIRMRDPERAQVPQSAT